jgi:hypothetical protein
MFGDAPEFTIQQGYRVRIELDFVEVLESYHGPSPYKNAQGLICEGSLGGFFGAEQSDGAAVWCHMHGTMSWPKGKEVPSDFDEEDNELGCNIEFLIRESRVIRS